MLNVKSVCGYITIAALVFSPLTVLAQDAQISTQNIYNGAEAVGDGNVINQGAIQQGVQSQLEVTGVYNDPQLQVSGHTDGYFHYVDQYGYQDSSQIQTQVDSYLGY
ncbi:MAG: hypothetical protein ACFCU5_19705 [Pleurocapsa sp.]